MQTQRIVVRRRIDGEIRTLPILNDDGLDEAEIIESPIPNNTLIKCCNNVFCDNSGDIYDLATLNDLIS